MIIEFMVDRLDATTPDNEVEAEIRLRCVEARERGADISLENEMSWVLQAVKRHRHNRRLHEFSVWALKD